VSRVFYNEWAQVMTVQQQLVLYFTPVLLPPSLFSKCTGMHMQVNAAKAMYYCSEWATMHAYQH
jgi:hypothetical protein